MHSLHYLFNFNSARVTCSSALSGHPSSSFVVFLIVSLPCFFDHYLFKMSFVNVTFLLRLVCLLSLEPTIENMTNNDTTKQGMTRKSNNKPYVNMTILNVRQSQEFAARIVKNLWVFMVTCPPCRFQPILQMSGSHWNCCHWWCGWCPSWSSLQRSSWYHRGCRYGAVAACGSLWLERARDAGGIGPLFFVDVRFGEDKKKASLNMEPI